MLRRSSYVLALASCVIVPTKTWAQGASLSERLSALGGRSQAPQQDERPLHSEARPTQRRQPTGKPSAVRQASNTTSGGIASKLGLGKLLPGGIFDRDSKPAVYDEPPAAYDNADSPAPRRGSASPPRSASSNAPTPRQRTGAASPSTNRSNARRAPGPETLADGAAGAGSAAAVNPKMARLDKRSSSSIRTARRSPTATPRSDELAEALRGIATHAEESEPSVGLSDMPPTETSDLPSYLQGVAPQQDSSQRPSASRTRTKSVGTDEPTFDLGAALRKAESHADEGPTSEADRDARAQTPTPTAQRSGARPSEARRSATRRTATASTAAARLEDRERVAKEAEETERESLGAIPAEPTPSDEQLEEKSSASSQSAVRRARSVASTQAPVLAEPETPSSSQPTNVATTSPSVAPPSTADSTASPSRDVRAFDAAVEQRIASTQDERGGAPAASASIRQTESMSATDGDNRQLLSSLQQPLLASRVEGPRQIIVGREAHYFVTLSNSGQTAADDVLVYVDVPTWAEVVDSTASQGIVETMRDSGDTKGANYGGKQLGWRLDELAAGDAQTLDLTLVPREGRAMQLGVRWNHAPVGAAAVVEVQEPLLHIEISGPSDVLYGDPQRYTLILDNPGTGVADDVTLQLLPPGGDDDSLVSHPVGAIAPGERKSIELELTARQAGDLAMKATAIAAGGLRTEIVKTVVCRKPELEMEWRGPDKKYSGSTATYYFRVRNPGTASTSPVAVEVGLPAGAEIVRASDGHTLNQNKDVVAWSLPGIRPGEEKFMELQCRLTRPGTNDFALVAKSSDGLLNVSKKITANVVALADLNLEIVDPTGPVPVGELAEYTVTIRNRGTTTARNINVVGLFSEGIEPVSAHGAQSTIGDGRVGFRTIDDLAAGRELVLRIEAKATKEGTHTFRAEVVCEDLEIKLSADETTRFFVDEFSWDSPSSAYAK